MTAETTTQQDLVTITVDGRDLQVPKGTLLWEACDKNGIDIPIFCYHTKLGPVGACRTCLVEVEGMPKGPITACSTPVTDGMKVKTKSPVVEKAQRGIFEFLLLNHPLDCPICDKGGECPLQDQTFAFGPGASRYVEPKRHHVKPIVLGPTIALDRERCVLCWRCVRFCAEVAEDKSIILLDRGDHTVVGTFQNEPYVSNFSGNVTELCPVGALTSRKQRFNFRPWELQNRPSICPHCAFGCNINVSVRKNDEVIRFISRDNPEVDDSWLCDHGRYNFEFINSPERLTAPLIRRGDTFHETSWSEAFQYIAERTTGVLEESGPNAVAGIATARLTNEDLHVFKRFMADVLGSANVDHAPRPPRSGSPASRDALDRALMPIAGLDSAKTIILLAADPSAREPVMELRVRLAMNRHGANLVVVNSDEISLSAKASSVVSYPSGGLVDAAGQLSQAIRDARAGSNGSQASLFAEGPFAVVYDDAFPGEADPNAALEAVAGVVAALGETGSVGVLPLLDACNSMGARDLAVLPAGAVDVALADRLLAADSPTRVAFLLGVNLLSAQPDPAVLQRLRRLDLLVVHELFMTDTARIADVVLPAASFAEKIGTFTNSERRIQMLRQTVPSPGVARADWEILADLSQYFAKPLDYSSPTAIWEDIREAVPAYAGISYSDLGAFGVRPTAQGA